MYPDGRSSGRCRRDKPTPYRRLVGHDDRVNNPDFFNESLTAWSAAATAILTTALVLIAIGTARTAIKTLNASHEANEQAKLDSIAQTRPYVYAEILPGLAGRKTYDIKITNSGQSSARDLTLDFTDWPEPPDHFADSVHTLFTTSRTLPPSCDIRAFWRLVEVRDPENPGVGEKTEGMPGRGTISVSYTSDDPSQPRYTDSFEVQIDSSGAWPVPEGGPNLSNYKSLKENERAFYKLGQAMIRRLGELNR